MPTQPYSLYLHIPFCQTRCTYCAFNTYTGLEALVEPYLRALEREIRFVGERAANPTSHTLYLGGGTPSLLSPRQAASLIAACRAHLGLISQAEISIEVNPGTVDARRLAGFRAAGINRVSLGVQSAQAADLRLFGRAHGFEQAAEAFRLARQVGFEDIGVDLIYGAPHQTRPGWLQTLDSVLRWQPDHVSLYSLSLEAGTSLHQRIERGLLAPPDPDLAADMYDDARARLDAGGFRQYELSNWARPGHECLHNCQYWLNRPYLGLGAGAHSASHGVRAWNVSPVPAYIRRMAEAPVPSMRSLPFPLSPATEDFETIDQPTAMTETMILGLRLVSEGVDGVDFASRFGAPPGQVFGHTIRDLETAGLLASSGHRLRLTEKAYLVSNRVFARFLP